MTAGVEAPGLPVRAQPGDTLPPHAELLTDLASAFQLIAEHRHLLAGVEIAVHASPYGVRIHLPPCGGSKDARFAAVVRLSELLRFPMPPTIKIGNYGDEYSNGFARWTVSTEVTSIVEAPR